MFPYRPVRGGAALFLLDELFRLQFFSGIICRFKYALLPGTFLSGKHNPLQNAFSDRFA
jgi:hypothetical protein